WQRPRPRARRDQEALPRVVVHRREVDLLEPRARDRDRVGDDVDAAALDVLLALRCNDRLELDPVGVAENRRRDLAQQVDLEPRDPAGERVEVPEEQGVLVDTHDEPAAPLDPTDEAPRWEAARPGQGRGRPEA